MRIPFDTFDVVGRTGLNSTNGYVLEEPLKELQGKRWRDIVREMRENDPVLGAVLFSIRNLAKQVSWEFQAKDPMDAKSQELVEFFSGCLFDDMSQSWQDTLSEIMTFLDWGYQLSEVCFKIRGGDSLDPTRNSKFSDGKVGWRKWAPRAQDTIERWIFDEDGGLVAAVQWPPPKFDVRTIPIEKCLLFRTEVSKSNPEGRSILRSAYTSYYYKTNIQRIEAIGIERDLAGLPILWVPPQLLASDASASELELLTQLKKIVTNIKRDEQEGLILPLSYDKDGHKIFELQLLSSSGNRQFDTDKIITRYDQRMAMACLADFILLGHEGVGSYSLGVSKTDLFLQSLTAFLDQITDVINRFAVPQLGRLNGFPSDKLPKLVHGTVKYLDLGGLGSFMQQLHSAGMTIFPNEELEASLLRAAKLPVPPPGQGGKSPPTPPPGSSPAGPPIPGARGLTGTGRTAQPSSKQPQPGDRNQSTSSANQRPAGAVRRASESPEDLELDVLMQLFFPSEENDG